MADTIDNLSIEISAKADAAVQSLTRLQNAIKPLGGAGRSAAGGMKVMTSDTEKAGSTLQRVSKDASTAGKNVRNVGKDAEDAGKSAKKGTSGISSFWGALKRIAFYRFVRSVIREITDAFKTGITNLYQWSGAVNGHFVKSMDRLATSTLYLKNSLGAMVSPLIESLVPVLDVIIDKFVDMLNVVNQVIAAISGADTYTVAKKVATAWSDSAKQTSNAIKEMKRTILGFDEINKLNGASAASGTPSSTSNDASLMFTEKPLTGGFAGFSNAIQNAMQDTLSKIALVLSGAEMIIGAILAFSGANIPLGLAMIADGAARTFSIAALNWEGLSSQTKLAIGAVETAVGIAMFGIGAVLAFSGANVGLGIAMMILGASTTVSGVMLNWSTVTGSLQSTMQAVGAIVGPAMFGLGAVITFAGHPGIGIAMMIAGASVAAVSINWNFIKEKLEGPLGGIVAMVSTASLALGILALIAGAVPIGLGLILLGVTGLASTVAANWDNLVNIGKQALKSVKKGWDSLKNKAFSIVAFIATTAGELWDGIKKAWDNLVDKALWFIVKVVDDAGKWWDDVKTWWAGKVGEVQAFTTYVKNQAGEWWLHVKDWWASKVDKVQEFTTYVKNQAAEWWLHVKDWWAENVGNVKDFLTGVKNDAGTWWENVKNWWHNTTVGKAVDSFTTNAKNTASTWWNNVKVWWASAISNQVAEAFITNAANRATQWWDDVKNWWKGITLNQYASDFLVNVANTALTWWNNVKRWWDGIKGTLTISILPTLGESNDKYYTSGEQYTQDFYEKYIAPLENKDPRVDVTIAPVGSDGISVIGNEIVPNIIDSKSIDINLWKTWWGEDPIEYLGLDNLSTTVEVRTKVSGALSNYVTRAVGGAFFGGMWHDIPQYAGGTTNAHGSLFLAGEAGPEIVGHVGGRTEVLNKSQLAAAMYSAVHSAMQGVTLDANFYGGGSNNSEGGGMTVDINDGKIVTLLNEVRGLLMQINDKELSVSTTAMNKAQSYMNRRAGATIVPVGT